MKKLLVLSLFSLLAWADGLLEVVPSRVEFGIVEAGKLSQPKKIKIKNIYSGDVVFGTVNIGGKNYLDFRIGVDHCSYKILKPGAECEVEVYFQPRVFLKKDEKIKKPKQLKREGLFVIPLSLLTDLDKTWKMAIPITGTALVRKRD